MSVFWSPASSSSYINLWSMGSRCFRNNRYIAAWILRRGICSYGNIYRVWLGRDHKRRCKYVWKSRMPGITHTTLQWEWSHHHDNPCFCETDGNRRREQSLVPSVWLACKDRKIASWAKACQKVFGNTCSFKDPTKAKQLIGPKSFFNRNGYFGKWLQLLFEISF